MALVGRVGHDQPMAEDPNVLGNADWEREYPGVRGTRVGALAGGRELGAAVYELDPGAQAVPYHMHHGQEELLIVLAGTPELRTPEGTRTLAPGAVVAFPAGPDGAHRVRNASGTTCRYVMVSTMRFPEIAEQLDTGTVLAMPAPGAGWAFPAGADADYMEQTFRAIQADPGAQPPA
jgi:uncharacterized cupin superfamily protein